MPNAMPFLLSLAQFTEVNAICFHVGSSGLTLRIGHIDIVSPTVWCSAIADLRFRSG
jgi:hypothetical protein